MRPGRVASKADTLPVDATALALYALPHPDARPTPTSPSLVVLDFDPVDVVAALSARAAPALVVETAEALHERIERARKAGVLRDPNSRGRLEFVRRWLVDHDPTHVGWQLEDAAIAGTGEAVAAER